MALIDKLTAIADAIRAKTGSTAALTLAEMPAAVEAIETGDSEAESMFVGLVQRTATDLHSDIVMMVGKYAFHHNTALKSVDFPECTSISEYGFYNCTFLERVNLPKVKTIPGSYPFGGCQTLTELRFPCLTTVSGGFLISGCTQLKALILPGDTVCALTSTYALGNAPIADGTCYVYVPSALVDSYKAAANWKKYPEQFRALEDYTVDGTVTGELDESKI